MLKSGLLAICFGMMFTFGLKGCLVQTDLMKGRTLEKVVISKPGNSNDFTQYDSSILEAFQGVIDRAEMETSNVAREEPEYEVQIEDTWGRYQTIAFWVGGKGEKSSLAIKDDPSTFYSVSEEDTVLLHQLIVYLFED